MARDLKRFKIELNSEDNLRDLLQNVIELCDAQILQAQDEINKLKNSTDLTQEVMDGKSKYAKAINDFLGVIDKATKMKIDVAKILNEVISHNGNLAEAMDSGAKSGAFNPSSLQSMIDATLANKESESDTKTIKLKKP